MFLFRKALLIGHEKLHEIFCKNEIEMKREGKIKAKREKVGKDDCRRGTVHACQEVYRFLLRRVFVMYIECSSPTYRQRM